MLKVLLLRSPDSVETKGSVLVGFEVHGHARAGKYGRDIVCAGVSAIAQASLLGLQDICGEQLTYRLEEGFMCVKLNPDMAMDQGAQAILRTFELGAISISKGYPKNVIVEYSE